ncbi:CHASE2 domain-containing protein [Oscillatoriales cyanobacterium LEGE 11467]|uniref:CHASE2 domain-containing protein n=1 Tax=Zarconia navalis LEGE 11467 TaxID=1828826 RepID=A0A928VVD9_9CYAN|nr:CHASE2 domain-containing protein [Zarconia navalis]MBE9039422.1 CHASE2 domain-containing protein [Zarconia navalis LEGE 11467]
MRREIWQTIKQELALWRVGALPGLAVIGLATIARLTGSLQFLEWGAIDLFLRLRPMETRDERVTIIGIDREDIERLGTYPVPDGDLARLLRRINAYKPIAIGLDISRELPVEPGHRELLDALQETPYTIAVERVRPKQSSVPNLPSEQIGFSDFPLDADLHVRRYFLGMPNPRNQGEYKFALSMRLAEIYLETTEDLILDNGIRDPVAMRFGDTEFPRVFPNSGGYVGTDAGGVQVLLNFRNHPEAFRILSLQDLETGNFEVDWLRDRIVLIGVTDPIYQSQIQTSAIAGLKPGSISGVEFQAHAVSQTLSAVLDGRSLLRTLPDGWEYLWIFSWGFVGIAIGHHTRSLLQNIVGVGLASISLLGTSYGVLGWGWWLPAVPPLLTLYLGNFVYTTFCEYDKALRSRIQERQRTIEQTFNVIHNGPLQTLANLLRHVRDWDWGQPKLVGELEKLNQELRALGEPLEREILTREDSLYLGSGHKLDLNSPMHELFYEVYSSTLERDFPGFKSLKIKARTFEELDSTSLSPDRKRELCRFLEEALCNVGKHAIGATRLSVTGTEQNGWYALRITDNGPGIYSLSVGRGTKQSQNLKTRLGGQFRRESHSPKGTLCELSWPVAKPRPNLFSRLKF